jgi:hypothetical protein
MSADTDAWWLNACATTLQARRHQDAVNVQGRLLCLDPGGESVLALSDARALYMAPWN